MSASGDDKFKDFKTILFLSVDIVGSTDYKHRTAKKQEWVETFTTFYRKFPRFLGKSIDDNIVSQDSSRPTLWKPVGDELIFRTPVKTCKEIQATVRSFQDAIRAYKTGERDYFLVDSLGKREKVSLKDLDLDLKGSCFTAVTPFPNKYLGDETLQEGEELEKTFEMNTLALALTRDLG